MLWGQTHLPRPVLCQCPLWLPLCPFIRPSVDTLGFQLTKVPLCWEPMAIGNRNVPLWVDKALSPTHSRCTKPDPLREANPLPNHAPQMDWPALNNQCGLFKTRRAHFPRWGVGFCRFTLLPSMLRTAYPPSANDAAQSMPDAV